MSVKIQLHLIATARRTTTISINSNCGSIGTFVDILQGIRFGRAPDEHVTNLVDIVDGVEPGCAFDIHMSLIVCQKVGGIGYDEMVVNLSTTDIDSLACVTPLHFELQVTRDDCFWLK